MLPGVRITGEFLVSVLVSIGNVFGDMATMLIWIRFGSSTFV